MRNTELNIAYIGGGSRGWAWTFMTDLALEPELGGSIRLYDIDKQAAKNNEIIGNRERPDAKGRWRYSAVDTLREALTGADFVIISILPGTFAEMRSDVHLPERLGIYQSVGDTAGPGGIIRALRTIPAYVEFAHAIRDFSPDAWVINYTNPMSLCLRTLYHAFPEIKTLGCCHEVFGMQKLLAAMVRRELGIENVTRHDININVLGLNHFTWINRASYRGYDLMEMYSRFVGEFYDSGFEDEKVSPDRKTFSCNNRMKFDLFRKYGWMGAAGDRHLAEFMPGDSYLKDPDTAERWGFYLTQVSWREAELQTRLARCSRLVSGEESIELTPTGEEGILLIKALCGLTRVISNVNLSNKLGQIENLPAETVVETNAVFSYNDVRPLVAGPLSDSVGKLIAPHAANQTEVLHAAIDCDRERVYAAFGRDPLVAGRASDADIRSLADDMIENTKRFLPDGWSR